MRLIINGDNIDSNAGTVKELLEELKIEPGRVAVEVNLAIIKKAEYESYVLKDGDRIEIVNFVGGGERETGDHHFAHSRFALRICPIAIGQISRSMAISCFNRIGRRRGYGR
ncbi:MAG: sulfur carrier protein [Nitrospirae bacterium]|nr:MAG: sulfur carrier protein [Nitrospirota bacterium]